MFSGCFQCFLGVSQKSWVNLLQAISDASGKITGRPLHKSDQNSWYNLHTRTAGGSLERSLELSSRGDCTRKFQEIVPRSRPQLSCGDDDKFFTTHSPGSIQTIVNSKVGYNFCWRNTGHLSQRRDTKHHTFFNLVCRFPLDLARVSSLVRTIKNWSGPSHIWYKEFEFVGQARSKHSSKVDSTNFFMYKSEI